LARQRFDPFIFGAQIQLDFRQGRGQITTLARVETTTLGSIAAVEVGPLAASDLAARAFRTRRAAFRSGRTSVIALRTAVVSPRSGWTITAGRARAATVPIAAAVGSSVFALVFGVL